MITRAVTRTVVRGVFASKSKVSPPVTDKLLLVLRPYAYGEDVIIDDIYGNTGDDVVVEWRGRYGEDVPIMGYMIPEDMQTEMFALLGEGLWFDAEGIAKQVNNIELAQSDEINVDGVWHRLDYAAGTGKREVYFYDTDLLTEDDIAVIAAWFKEGVVVPPIAKIFVPIRIDRTSKPPLGTPLRSDGHWSVKGLCLAEPYNELGGSTLIPSAGVYQNNVGLKTSWCADGVMWKGLSTDYVTFFGLTAKEYTLYSFGACDTLAANFQFFDQDNYSGDTRRMQFGVYPATPGQIELVVFNTGSSPFFAYSPSIVSAKKPFSAAAVLKGNIATVYADGEPGTPTNITGTPRGLAVAYPIYAGNSTRLNKPYLGSISCQLIYDVAHDPIQIASLSANPWQVYEPETVWVEI